MKVLVTSALAGKALRSLLLSSNNVLNNGECAAVLDSISRVINLCIDGLKEVEISISSRYTYDVFCNYHYTLVSRKRG
jgi:hypothetical protein